MIVGHLAPVGPIATAVGRRWRPEWPRWTRALPWVATLAGCVFPDLDVIVYTLATGRLFHLYYWPHSLVPYLPVLALGWLLARRQRTRLAGLVVLAFGTGVLSHLLLDVASHGTVVLYPLWDGLVGWTHAPNTAYLHTPNALLEVIVLAVGAAWWLRRTVRLAGWRGSSRTRLRRLSALPRHEGSRLLRSARPDGWLDKSGWMRR